MKRWLLRLFYLALIAVALNAFRMHGRAPQVPADINNPERTVSGQKLISKHTPAVELDFGSEFQYAGAQRFLLYGVASAEQHFFVDAGPDQRIRRVFWVQFEGYLPGNSFAYDYSKSAGRAQIGGLDFFTDAYAARVQPPRNPDSDGARARQLLQAKGYKYPEEILSLRLVHLTDDTRRHELMIIYAEDLALSGLKADAVDQARINELSKEILARAQQHMKLTGR